eukprot:CAMPEP_0168520986 /NCGR_PEP_ID=MMETSP0405-20121227/8382_1 /TAXON_ID=498012 /ORGANISM="Trichosphaerium sp, Strain Am-I-7 wt" /LENGTH=131 /DNA_ID=CAMNT_0008542109 /DNA_START=589 /DNA_END=980 /DNA_ORIENTATION=-
MAFQYDTTLICAIIATGFLALAFNLSIFLIIGKTSPVTYNVLGHFKTCCVLIGHFTIFGHPLLPQQVIGIGLTLLGIFWYSYIKLNAATPPEVKASDIEQVGEDKETLVGKKEVEQVPSSPHDTKESDGSA